MLRIILCTYSHSYKRLNPYKCCLFIHLNLSSVNVCVSVQREKQPKQQHNNKKHRHRKRERDELLLLPCNLSMPTMTTCSRDTLHDTPICCCSHSLILCHISIWITKTWNTKSKLEWEQQLLSGKCFSVINLLMELL